MKNKLFRILSAVLFLSQVNGQEVPDKLVVPEEQMEEFEMKLTARVINEEGKPMAGVPVLIRICNLNNFQDQYNDFRGETDEEGKLTAEALGHGVIKIEVRHEGYYPSFKEPNFNEQPVDVVRAEKRFFPWNPVVDIMIKKVGKPIPMYVRVGSIKGAYGIAPVVNQPVEWDILKADWLPPHGSGEQGDLIFIFQGEYVRKTESFARMEMKFANGNDGLIEIKELFGVESALDFPREAPKNGYNIKHFKAMKQSPSREGIREQKDLPLVELPVGYFVRFRTKLDEDGEVISALYGKIVEPITVQSPGSQSPMPTFRLRAYLNPNPNDRNLEFNQYSNLAPEGQKGTSLAP